MSAPLSGLRIQDVSFRSDLYVIGIKVGGSHGLGEASLDARLLKMVA